MQQPGKTPTHAVADPKILKRATAEDMYQLRPHLSHMRTTKYMRFTRKKADIWKKYMSQ